MFGVGMNFGAGSLTLEVVDGQATTVNLDVGQSGNVQLPALDADGSPIDFTNRTLQFVVSDFRGATVLDVDHANIILGNGNFTIALNTDTTAKRRTLRWQLLDVSGGQAPIKEGHFAVA